MVCIPESFLQTQMIFMEMVKNCCRFCFLLEGKTGTIPYVLILNQHLILKEFVV